MVLDVREDDEWQRGHVASTQHIPMGDVPARMARSTQRRTVRGVPRRRVRDKLRVANFLSGSQRLHPGQRQRRHAGLDGRRPARGHRRRRRRHGLTGQPPKATTESSLGWSDDPGVFAVRDALERARPATVVVPAVWWHAARTVGSRTASGHPRSSFGPAAPRRSIGPGFRWIAVRPGARRRVRQQRRPSDRPRYPVIPRWGLRQYFEPEEQRDVTRSGPSRFDEIKLLILAMAMLGFAVFAHLVLHPAV